MKSNRTMVWVQSSQSVSHPTACLGLVLGHWFLLPGTPSPTCIPLVSPALRPELQAVGGEAQLICHCPLLLAEVWVGWGKGQVHAPLHHEELAALRRIQQATQKGLSLTVQVLRISQHESWNHLRVTHLLWVGAADPWEGNIAFSTSNQAPA